MVFIGNVEIPFVYSIDELNDSEVDEISSLPSKEKDVDNIAVQHEPSIKRIIIYGYLNEEVHSEQKSIDQQKKDVKGLRRMGVTDNTFDYRTYKGHLVIENIDLTDNSNSKIVNEVVVEASYHPWPKYFPESNI